LGAGVTVSGTAVGLGGADRAGDRGEPSAGKVTAGASEGAFTAGDEHAASNIMTTTNMAPVVVFRGLRNERNASMLESYRLLRGARKDFDKSRVSRPGKCCACG